MNTYCNDHGIDVKVCCMSCSHFINGLSRDEAKKYGSNTICARDNTIAKRDFVCAKWVIKKGLMNVGANATGEVHSPEYITFYRANLDEANAYIDKYMAENANDLTLRMQCPSIPQYIYKKWRDTYGARPIYMNI